MKPEPYLACYNPERIEGNNIEATGSFGNKNTLSE